MAQAPVTQPPGSTAPKLGGSVVSRLPVVVSRVPLAAADLPPLMEVPDPRGSYRFPLLQFIADWNRSDNPEGLIVDPPVYDGDDPVLLPAIAVVVHALASRAGLPIPEWVLGHRAPHEVALFVPDYQRDYRRWLMERSHPLSAYHRVHIHPRMLDKGTPDWWLPWD